MRVIDQKECRKSNSFLKMEFNIIKDTLGFVTESGKHLLASGEREGKMTPGPFFVITEDRD